jgi:hypothetical protein
LSDEHRITDINVEAGNHAMPQDPREIELALRAAKSAWDRYPYLAQRYGERGRRFTDSDSCWLVTLARAPNKAVVTKALDWLRSVLASRGLPTVILESHLQAIADEFAAQFGVQVQFDQFLAERQAERRTLLDGEGRPHLVETFGQRFRSCAGFQVDSAAELIASAWVDERSGIALAVPALCDWLTDAERFSTEWIGYVRAMLAELDRVHAQAI